jgi:DNA-binding NtrC family response regulator
MNENLPISPKNPGTAVSGIGIDSNGGMAERIRAAAQEQCIVLREVLNLPAVIVHFASHGPGPILVGLADSGTEAMSLFEAVCGVSPDSPVIVILKQHSVTDAVRFMRNRAFDCLGPAATACELSTTIRGAFEYIAERRVPAIDPGAEAWRRLLVGQSPAIERVAKIIRLIAPRRCTVLISGETGTGKRDGRPSYSHGR